MSNPPRDREQAIEAFRTTAESLMEDEKAEAVAELAAGVIHKIPSIPIVDGVFLLDETAIPASEINRGKPHSMLKGA